MVFERKDGMLHDLVGDDCYIIRSESYPGSADDAATYLSVELEKVNK